MLWSSPPICCSLPTPLWDSSTRQPFSASVVWCHCEKTVVNVSTNFVISGQPIHALSREDSGTYLGIEFAAEGQRHQPLAELLSSYLQRLAKAPLKPQQRFYALKTKALAKLHYYISLRLTTVSELIKVDRMVSVTVRQWLALPNETLTGYFHANVEDWGLRILSVSGLRPFTAPIGYWDKSLILT